MSDKEDQTYLWTYWGAEDSANPELDVSYGLEREGFCFKLSPAHDDEF